MQREDLKLKQYLMETLTERETAEIDLRIISDEAFAEELSLAESDLIEDYLEGSLSDDEARLFHSNFLISPARTAQLAEISLVKSYARSQAVQKKQTESAEASPAKLTDILRAYLRPIAIGAAMVAAVLIVGSVWFGYLGSSGTPLEKEYAELNKRDLSNVMDVNAFSSVNLSVGSFRDASSAARQNEEKLGDTVLFRLALPSKVAEGSTLRAKISRGTALVFTVAAAKVYQNTGGQEIRLLLPKKILQKGQYQIRIENASGVEAGTYAFEIE